MVFIINMLLISCKETSYECIFKYNVFVYKGNMQNEITLTTYWWAQNK